MVLDNEIRRCVSRIAVLRTAPSAGDRKDVELHQYANDLEELFSK